MDDTPNSPWFWIRQFFLPSPCFCNNNLIENEIFTFFVLLLASFCFLFFFIFVFQELHGLPVAYVTLCTTMQQKLYQYCIELSHEGVFFIPWGIEESFCPCESSLSPLSAFPLNYKIWEGCLEVDRAPSERVYVVNDPEMPFLFIWLNNIEWIFTFHNKVNPQG